MNERIRALAKQATKTLDVKHEGYRGKGYTEQVEFFDKEKFAELIVRECAKVAKKVDGDEGDDYKSGRTWAGIDVLKHFGVEE